MLFVTTFKAITSAPEYVGYSGKTLMDLPQDIILVIIKSLDFPTFISTLTLTKKWFEVSKSDFLATHFFLTAQEQLAKGIPLQPGSSLMSASV